MLKSLTIENFRRFHPQRVFEKGQTQRENRTFSTLIPTKE